MGVGEAASEICGDKRTDYIGGISRAIARLAASSPVRRGTAKRRADQLRHLHTEALDDDEGPEDSDPEDDEPLWA